MSSEVLSYSAFPVVDLIYLVTSYIPYGISIKLMLFQCNTIMHNNDAYRYVQAATERNDMKTVY